MTILPKRDLLVEHKNSTATQYVISGIPLLPTNPEGDVAAGSLFELPTNSAFQFPKADCGKN
jgi:hypothetical protein